LTLCSRGDACSFNRQMDSAASGKSDLERVCFVHLSAGNCRQRLLALSLDEKKKVENLPPDSLLKKEGEYNDLQMSQELFTWIWALGGVALILAEIVLPHFFSGFLGVAAILVAALRWMGWIDSFQSSFIVWMILSVVL